MTRSVIAIARHEVRLLRHDPAPFVVVVAMPLLVISFVRPLFRLSLVEQGYVGVNGAEQAVPGITVMFAFFLVAFIGISFFHEHRWNTWNRLRASPAGVPAILIGKSLPLFAVAVIQQLVLVGGGSLLFGVTIAGETSALLAIALVFAATITALGLVIVSFCRTIQQVEAFSNVAAITAAGLGGALTPADLLPDWARDVAPAVPSYWAVRAYRSVILDGAGWGDLTRPVLVLAAMAGGLLVLALVGFRVTDTKSYLS